MSMSLLDLNPLILAQDSMAQLRLKCKAFQLPRSGKKSDLIDRLLAKSSTLSMSEIPRTPVTPKRVIDSVSPVGKLLLPLNYDLKESPASPFQLPKKSALPPLMTIHAVQNSWFGRFMTDQDPKTISYSTFGIQESCEESPFLLDGAVRFWISRFFHIIEFYGVSGWNEFEITGLEMLSPDLIAVKEKSQINNHTLHHLVVFQTGHVAATYRSCIPNDWRDFAARIAPENMDRSSPYEDLHLSIITCVPCWDDSFPCNISVRIPRQSFEYLIALRFILAHSEGLTGSSTDTAFKRNSNGILRKCILTVPFEIAVVSVHLTDHGYALAQDVAFIQTFGSEGIYVLINTGQSIGKEGQGICQTWREILRCTERGLPLAKNALEDVVLGLEE